MGTLHSPEGRPVAQSRSATGASGASDTTAAPTTDPAPEREPPRVTQGNISNAGGVRRWAWPDVHTSAVAFPPAGAGGGRARADGEKARASSEGRSGGAWAAAQADRKTSGPAGAWHPYLHPDDRDPFAAALAPLLAGPAEISLEARFRFAPDRDYRCHLFRATSRRTPAGRLSAAGSLVDIEDRKTLERQLERSNDKLRLAVQGHAVGVWDWPDTSQDYIQISEELRVFMGYAPDEIEDSMTWIFGIVHPDDLAGVQDDIGRVLATGGKYVSEFRIAFADRGYRWVRSAGVITRDAGGPGVHRLTGALSDVHEQHRAKDRLSAANRQLEEFAYLIAHDLSSPLRHIQAFSQFLRDEEATRLSATGRDYLETIVGSAERMQGLIADMLVYARAGTEAIVRRPVDLAALIAALRDELVSGDQARHVRWAVDAELPVVSADARQMRQLFQNLLTNAAKFTRHTPAAEVSVRAHTTDEHHVITVADNGVGFEPALAERIFDAFDRGNNAARFEGTGIGLAHVARILERHNGHVTARGAVGEGATFVVELPRV